MQASYNQAIQTTIRALYCMLAHVDQVSLETLFKVVQECLNVRVVLQQYKVLHPCLVSSVQGTLHSGLERLPLYHLRHCDCGAV